MGINDFPPTNSGAFEISRVVRYEAPASIEYLSICRCFCPNTEDQPVVDRPPRAFWDHRSALRYSGRPKPLSGCPRADRRRPSWSDVLAELQQALSMNSV